MADKIITANREHPEPVKPISEDIDKLNEFVTKRVDSMRTDSTVYKYYVNTPLNELKSKEEKAIKREITRRQMEALNEEAPYGPTDPIKNAVYGYNNQIDDSFVNRIADRVKGSPNKFNSLQPDVVGNVNGTKPSIAPEGGDPDPEPKPNPNKVEEAGLFDSIMEFITSIPETFASFFGEESTLYKAYSSIVDYVHSLTTKFMGDDVSKEDVAGGVKYTFATAAAILGLIAAWKLIKRFVNKDGTVQSPNPATASVAASEAVAYFTINNESLATLSVCNESTDTPTNTMSTYIKKHADRMLSDLLNDDQFIKYMEKNNPKLLKSLKKYKMKDVVVSENVSYFMQNLDETVYGSTDPVKHKMYGYVHPIGDSIKGIANAVKNFIGVNSLQPDVIGNINGSKSSLSTSDGDPCPPKVVDALSSVSDKISTVANKIYKAFDVTSDGFKSAIQHAKDKVKTLTHKVESSDVNSIAKTAGYGALLILAVASVWYFYKKYQKKKEANSKDVMASESNMMYMDKLISIYSILEENAPIKSTTNADKDIKLSAIRGKDNVLINNLCNRAKFVSSSLISDKDFVSFAKKANPEVLSYMKAINKVNNKEKEKN